MSKNNKSKIVNQKDNSKLVDTFIIIGIVFLIGSLILMFFGGKKEGNNIVEINYNEYKEKIAEDKYNVILLTSPTCSHCVSYKPYVNAVANDYDLEVYNLNLNTLEYDQYIEIHDAYTVTKDEYDENNVPGIPTPVTIITKNGEEVKSILGDIGSTGFLNLLKTNNVIK